MKDRRTTEGGLFLFFPGLFPTGKPGISCKGSPKRAGISPPIC